MGKYDGAAEQAAQKTDEELKEAISELVGVDIPGLFPNPADQNIMNELIATVGKSTEKNEMITACQVLAVKLTAEGLKAFKEGFSLAKKIVI